MTIAACGQDESDQEGLPPATAEPAASRGWDRRGAPFDARRRQSSEPDDFAPVLRDGAVAERGRVRLPSGESCGVRAFAIARAAVAIVAARRPAPGPVPGVADRSVPAPAGEPAGASAWTRRAAWLALPALASLGLVAATEPVSHAIAPEPRLWIATLALYLANVVLAFDHPRG